MTTNLLHIRINSSIKILGGLALGAMIFAAVTMPLTASADPAVLPLRP